MALSTLDRNWLEEYPAYILRALKKLAQSRSAFYVTGGAVRDWLQGKKASDLDLTTSGDAIAAARTFANDTGGAFVMLDQDEGVARVVSQGITVDFSSFRDDTRDILSDLACRDFSINAMALAINSQTGTLSEPLEVIDPLNGARDLREKCVRAPNGKVFDKDPLRILRAFRFAAENDFAIEPQTLRWLREKKSLVSKPAAERIRYELDLIMASERAGVVFKEMSDLGLIEYLFPELLIGKSVEQPSSHHQDVFDHNLTVLLEIERVIQNPVVYFPDQHEIISVYLKDSVSCLALKWAAVFHDVGKPETLALKKDDRITFYNHDQVGAQIWESLGRRYCWSNNFIVKVAALIRFHMYPFHLNNSLQTTGITPRACLKLVKTAGDDLPGLFVLAMADSLAARGENKPAGMEKNLAELYRRVDEEYYRSIKKVMEGPPLVTGDDLIALGFEPGPLFGEILDEIEGARVAGEINDRQEALEIVVSRYKSAE